MERNYQTTSIPHRFLLSNFEKYCTIFKPLFMAESTCFRRFRFSTFIVCFVS
jgi:hypothetical protein